jgi:hypothetical protein
MKVDLDSTAQPLELFGQTLEQVSPTCHTRQEEYGRASCKVTVWLSRTQPSEEWTAEFYINGINGVTLVARCFSDDPSAALRKLEDSIREVVENLRERMSWSLARAVASP